MSERSDRQSARAKYILERLQENQNVSVDDLCKELHASIATVRRDLLQLEGRGLLRRTHGGAVSIEPLFYEPFKNDSSFQDLVERFAPEKKRIGRAAAAMVTKGSSVALTPGTTTNEVVRSFAPDNQLRVVTNAVNVAMELSKRKDIDVFVTGGHLRGDWFSLVGSGAIDNVRRSFVDVVFLGANAVDSVAGLTCDNPEEAELNRAMMLQATKKIAVADHSKLGRRSAWQLCAISDIDVLITDSGATKASVAPFLELGIEVIRA